MLPLLPFAVWHRPFAVTGWPAASSGGTEKTDQNGNAGSRSGQTRQGADPSSFPQTRQPRGGQFGAYLVPTVGASTRPHFACKLIAFSLSRAQFVPWCRWCQAPSGGRPLSTASRPIHPSAAHSRARRAQPSALLLLRVYGHGAGSVCRVRLRSPKRLPMRACAESAQGHRVDRVTLRQSRASARAG
jgi:hypothetical protein